MPRPKTAPKNAPPGSLRRSARGADESLEVDSWERARAVRRAFVHGLRCGRRHRSSDRLRRHLQPVSRLLRRFLRRVGLRGEVPRQSGRRRGLRAQSRRVCRVYRRPIVHRSRIPLCGRVPRRRALTKLAHAGSTFSVPCPRRERDCRDSPSTLGAQARIPRLRRLFLALSAARWRLERFRSVFRGDLIRARYMAAAF